MVRAYKESDAKREFANKWQGWLNYVEPTTGSSIGSPDVEVLLNGQIVKIEFKVGKIINGLLFMRKVRGQQIQWHRSFSLAGGNSLFCTGIDWNEPQYLTNGKHIKLWKKGFLLGVDCVDTCKPLDTQFDMKKSLLEALAMGK